MKYVLVFLLVVPTVLLAGCNEKVKDNHASVETVSAQKAMPAGEAQNVDVWRGEIMETMNSGGYSYLKFMKDGKEAWVAGPVCEGLKVGQEVEMSPGMLMTNFHAKSLNRDFAEIYFVGSLSVPGQVPAETTSPHGGTGMGMGGMSNPHGGSGSVPAMENIKVDPVEKADGGFTVAEIYSKAQTLSEQSVLVRGNVVKFSPNIMGTNWIHIQDGTGEGETGDLTVTTNTKVAVGDVILVEGPLSVKKDFGSGYFYEVIIEDAKVTLE
ncbi:MAG: hypothetical protein KOO60_03700 [Gemmatimonadales bacterium]|nr:hypothetical protein [Gemmatimonadales bacterium]